MIEQTHNHLDDTDKMLLGEMEVKALTPEQDTPQINGRNGYHDHNAHEHIREHEYNPLTAHPLTATHVTLVKTDRKGNLIQDDKTDDLVKDTEPHKKRAISSTDGVVDEYPVKKRVSSKKKQTDGGGPVPVTASKKSTAANRKGNGAAIKLEQNRDHGNVVEPVTPTRTKRDTANGKVTPGRTSADSKSTSTSPSKPNDLTTKSTPRKRNAPKGGIADQRGIPASWEDADDADKMIFTLKSQGAPWAVIREKWTAMTGIETAPSTLPNRLNRMRVLMMHFREGDDTLFIQMKKEVEESLERDKWQNIANKMRANNAQMEYPIAFLQKKDKEFQEAVQKGTASRAISNAMKGVFENDREINEDSIDEDDAAREDAD